jgi:hypothetical protein
MDAPMLVAGDLAKAHLFLYLIGRFNRIWLDVHPSRCEPAGLPTALVYDLADPDAIQPFTVTMTGVEGEVPSAAGLRVEARVPWAAVYRITGGGVDYEVDDPPANEPNTRPLTLIRGGKA